MPRQYKLPRGMFFIGMDVALKNDYYAICVHALPRDRTEPWLPKLVKLIQFRAKSYPDIWEALTKPDGMLKPYEAFKGLSIDYTTERGTGDFLEKKFGEYRVQKVVFTPGVSGTKMRIANATLDILNSGYQWPPLNRITNPIDRENIKLLKRQIIEEATEPKPDGSVRFYHKLGTHNDLLHAFQLSLDICRQYMLAQQGRTGYHVLGPTRKKQFNPYQDVLGSARNTSPESILRNL